METIRFTNEQIKEVISKFNIDAQSIDIEPISKGHVNRSWKVNTGARKYILQNLNPFVFSSIEVLVKNHETITEFLKSTAFNDTFKVPELVKTVENRSYYATNEGDNWRMLHYIDHHHNYVEVMSEEQAYSAAQAYGQYAKYLTQIPLSMVGQTIRNFHDPEERIVEFGEAIENDLVGRRREANPEINFIRSNSEYARKISKMINSQALTTRITHNNTALDNLLWNKNDQVCAIVDLDTTMPSTLLYDFGDMIRTYTVQNLDNAADTTDISIQYSVVNAIIDGYLQATSQFMTPTERNSLFDGTMMVIYIQAVRYMTDYLKGDRVYPITYPQHNIQRVRNHFELIRQLQAREKDIRKQIR